MKAIALSLLLFAACASEPAPVSPPPVPPPATAAATAPAPDEPVPTLRLPGDTRPLAEAIELHLDPRQDRYTGSVDIDVQLDAPRQIVWLHGKDFTVTRATMTPDGGAPIDATWQERHESGVAALTLARQAPAGKGRVHIEFGAAFGRGSAGLYRTKEADVEYAFTQFEAIEARQAFPCFDEPGFKIPFTTTLVVPAEMTAVANTHEVSRAADGGNVRVAFAPTLPLPSYLVAFAVGTLDVVAAPDVPPNGVRTRTLPLRAIAAKGRGKEIAYALAHAGEIVSTLEKYIGIEYPWDKLDIVAVPGKGGAMENAGLITFGEQSLLMDPATASVGQKRAYAAVMAHELAHQWTGDLVTMAWWDDTWLNEAFATWLGSKTADLWNPASHSEMGLLISSQAAMEIDSLTSARSIRQPIASTHDIANAFDAITYRKGGQVLLMFERWAGADAWQRGLRTYLTAHRYGNGTADDFLQAENDATGKDVKTAFHTFLDQPGVPLVEASVQCASTAKGATLEAPNVTKVLLKQSRFLPTGSTGSTDASWQIPVCVRTDAGASCTLLTGAQGSIDLAPASACPAFVLPNADAAGYYRFSLAPRDLDALRKNVSKLTERERVAYATSLRGAWSRGSTPMRDVMQAEEPLARDAEPAVAEAPMMYVDAAREWLFADPLRAKTEAYARSLYAPVARQVGWDGRKDDKDDAWTLRASVLGFAATTGHDPAVRAEARKRGLAYAGVGKDGAIHPEAVEADLAGVALGVAGEEADRPTWDALRASLAKTLDETVRRRLLRALAFAHDPALSAAARELVLDPALRDSEVMTPLFAQLSRPETRDAAWAWLKEHYDAILARMPRHRSGVQLVGAGSGYCDEDHARDIEAFFGSKVDGIEGGPRALKSTLEAVRLCAARRKAQETSARDFFGKK